MLYTSVCIQDAPYEIGLGPPGSHINPIDLDVCLTEVESRAAGRIVADREQRNLRRTYNVQYNRLTLGFYSVPPKHMTRNSLWDVVKETRPFTSQKDYASRNFRINDREVRISSVDHTVSCTHLPLGWLVGS